MKTAADTPRSGSPPLDVAAIRADFPILQRTVNGHPLCYLDSAATAQKPRQVLDALQEYYTTHNANIHRGVHTLSVEATRAYECARQQIQRFVRAARPEEIVFVRSATEAINLVAQAFARPQLGPGDEVLITTMEHHSNIVPWQLACEQTGATLKAVPITDDGELVMERCTELLGSKTKIFAVTHVSNALGTINPVRELVELARGRDVPVLVDGAQAAPHMAIDVGEIGCDFYAITGHKMFGPTGIGALYGRHELLDSMPPYQGGGEMILSVSIDKTTYNAVPHKFEAGTPHIAGAIGMGVAAEYIEGLGLDRVAAHEHDLLQYATAALLDIPGVRNIGQASSKAAVLSFLVGDVHPHDVGTVLDQEGVAIRTGHHCAQPVMEHFGIASTARASLAIYNDRDDVDRLAAGVRRVGEVFG